VIKVIKVHPKIKIMPSFIHLYQVKYQEDVLESVGNQTVDGPH